MPTFEYRKIDTDANWPVSLLTTTRDPFSVSAVRVLKTDDRTATVDYGAVNWSLGEEGLAISNIVGLSAGTKYTVTLEIKGTR